MVKLLYSLMYKKALCDWREEYQHDFSTAKVAVDKVQAVGTIIHFIVILTLLMDMGKVCRREMVRLAYYWVIGRSS